MWLLVSKISRRSTRLICRSKITLVRLMAMHSPPHPGEFIIQVYLEPDDLSGCELAGKLGVAASTLNRILIGTSRVSPEMALRLSKALGRSPESWLAMQHVKLSKVGKVRLTVGTRGAVKAARLLH